MQEVNVTIAATRGLILSFPYFFILELETATKLY